MPDIRVGERRLAVAAGSNLLDALLAGGIAVLNTGHLHPKVIAAVQEQLGKLSHTCFQVLAYEPYIELAEEI
ncbi:aminotransferase class III-fold pyridoxal phosphate-dependent enzyme, partial [Klebsiella pneumoniae]